MPRERRLLLTFVAAAMAATLFASAALLRIIVMH